MTTDKRKPSLTIHSFPTPNGRRVTVLLEVLGVKFNHRKVDIFTGEQSQSEFLEINPTGKIPAITDTIPGTNEEVSLFETGAIIQFLANKYDTKFEIHYRQTDALYWEETKWFYFTTSTLSPVQGELSFFLNFAKQNDEFAIARAQSDVARVYKTMETRLQTNNGWFVGDKLNIVDISAFTFINRYEFVKLELESTYPNIWAWLLKVRKIDGFERGYNYELS
jgi:glutathione S-transferase